MQCKFASGRRSQLEIIRDSFRSTEVMLMRLQVPRCIPARQLHAKFIVVPGQSFGIFIRLISQKMNWGNMYWTQIDFRKAVRKTKLLIIQIPNIVADSKYIAHKNLSLYVLLDRAAGNCFFNGTRRSLYNFDTPADQGHTVIHTCSKSDQSQ